MAQQNRWRAYRRLASALTASLLWHSGLLVLFAILAPSTVLSHDFVTESENIVADRDDTPTLPFTDPFVGIVPNEDFSPPAGGPSDGSGSGSGNEGKAERLDRILPDGPPVREAGGSLPETGPIGSPLPGRFDGDPERKERNPKGGASSETEAAVARGLLWLQRVQSPDGRWLLDGPFPDKGQANDTAGTALGLLPFLAAGKTHLPGKNNPYDKPVGKALAYLLGRQNRRTGDLSGGMYGHGLATIALCECYGLTHDLSLRRPAQMAINFIVAAQHEAGGWRYTPREAGDMSVTGWQIMALKSGLLAGLDVPSITLRKAQRFLDSMATPDDGYGYTSPAAAPTTSAIGLLCRQFLQGWGPRNPRLIAGVDNHLRGQPPGSKQDSYHFYYATQVMHGFGGEGWKRWDEAMRKTLVQSQEAKRDQPTYGSWPASADAWGNRGGGRLMVTALNLLTLEVYYRYLPLYDRGRAFEKDKS